MLPKNSWKSSPSQLRLLFLSRQAAPTLLQIHQSPVCGNNPQATAKTSLSVLFRSVSFPFSLIQLLIWQRSKEINEELQQKDDFLEQGIVDRRREMRILWVLLKTVYLSVFFGRMYQRGIRLQATAVQLCLNWCLYAQILFRSIFISITALFLLQRRNQHAVKIWPAVTVFRNVEPG